MPAMPLHSTGTAQQCASSRASAECHCCRILIMRYATRLIHYTLARTAYTLAYTGKHALQSPDPHRLEQPPSHARHTSRPDGVASPQMRELSVRKTGNSEPRPPGAARPTFLCQLAASRQTYNVSRGQPSFSCCMRSRSCRCNPISVLFSETRARSTCRHAPRSHTARARLYWTPHRQSTSNAQFEQHGPAPGRSHSHHTA